MFPLIEIVSTPVRASIETSSGISDSSAGKEPGGALIELDSR
jgi:hypothetical protein